MLAIWARETNYGAAKMPHSAIRALATQAYLGRRKEQFREEFLLALKMLQEGHVTLADMRCSWAGAMGQPQLLPSGFYKYAIDFDGDGRRDIWTSVPDALGTIANHLVELGWQRGQRWAYEVRAPRDVDCTIAQPEVKTTIGEWVRRGYAPAHGAQARRGGARAGGLAADAGGTLRSGVPHAEELLRAEGLQFLRSLCAVRRPSRRPHRGRGAPSSSRGARWRSFRPRALERMQRELTRRGFYQDKIDGKAGMLTRAALGAYQKANGLKLDCWPTQAVLDHMQSAQ